MQLLSLDAVQVRVEDIYCSSAPMSESRCSFVVAKAVGNTEADAGLGSCLLNTRARSEPAAKFSQRIHERRRPLLEKMCY